MGLPGTIDQPRPEDFGVTAGDVERAPELVVTRFRLLIFLVLYIVVFAVVFAFIFAFSDSIPAALTFGLIVVAAVSIVLVPILLCALCASEKLETRWLCRRFPAIKECLAYQEAMAEFRRLTRRPPEGPHDHAWWTRLSGPTFRGQVQQALNQRNLELTPVADREAEGYDYTFRDTSGKVLIRCEAGATRIDIGVGRELTACLDETGAGRAIVVTPSGVSKRLAAYLMDHSIDVVDPEQILGNPPAEL